MRYLLITSLLVFGSASQERDTIVDSARRHGGKATVDIDILAPVGTLNRLVEESTLVVRGVVHSVTTSLSHDEMIVVTEFEIAPLRFYKGALPVSKKPGEIERLVVQRPGGTLMFEGLELRTVVDAFPESESSLAVGDQLILFLAPDEAERGTFRITRNAFGAYRIRGGNVVALTSAAAERRKDRTKTVAAFEHDLAALMRH